MLGENKIGLPTSYTSPEGYKFKLFSVAYNTVDDRIGPKHFYIYALSHLHAVALLDDVHSSAVVLGQLGE